MTDSWATPPPSLYSCCIKKNMSMPVPVERDTINIKAQSKQIQMIMVSF